MFLCVAWTTCAQTNLLWCVFFFPPLVYSSQSVCCPASLIKDCSTEVVGRKKNVEACYVNESWKKKTLLGFIFQLWPLPPDSSCISPFSFFLYKPQLKHGKTPTQPHAEPTLACSIYPRLLEAWQKSTERGQLWIMLIESAAAKMSLQGLSYLCRVHTCVTCVFFVVFFFFFAQTAM